jgi:hypothetical protein
MACKTKKQTGSTTTKKNTGKKGTAKTTKKTTKKSQKTVAPMIVHGPETAIPTPPPTHEQIAARAYALYERRGYIHGHDVEDWLAAEAELTA